MTQTAAKVLSGEHRVVFFTKLFQTIQDTFICRIKNLDLDDSVKEHVGISKILIDLCTAFCAGASGQEKSRGSENRTECFYDIIFFKIRICDK